MSKADLLDLLIRVEDCLDQYSDVKDGDYGEPVPNRAMTMQQEVEEAIKALEAEGKA